MGFTFTPTSDPDFGTVEQYFRDYNRQRAIWLASKGGFDTVEDEDGVVTLVEREKVEKTRGYTVHEPYERIEIAELGRSPKGVANALLAMGWTVSAWRQVGEWDEVLYVGDSKEGGPKEYSAGDVKFPAKVVRRYCLEGRFGEHEVGIQAFYEGEGLEDAKGKPATSASFDWCRIRDSAYGIIIVDTVDYTRSKVVADDKGWTEERRVQEGMAMNRRYPAESHKVHVMHYHAGDPMNQWIDLYLDLTKTENGGKRLTRKKPEPEAPVDEVALIREGGEWQA